MTPPPRDEAVPLWIFRYCPGLYCDKEIHGDAASHVALPAAAYAALLTRVEAAEGAVEAAYREGYAEGYSDRGRHGDGAADLEAWTNSAARLALRASGTREGE